MGGEETQYSYHADVEREEVGDIVLALWGEYTPPALPRHRPGRWHWPRPSHSERRYSFSHKMRNELSFSSEVALDVSSWHGWCFDEERNPSAASVVRNSS